VVVLSSAQQQEFILLYIARFYIYVLFVDVCIYVIDVSFRVHNARKSIQEQFSKGRAGRAGGWAEDVRNNAIQYCYHKTKHRQCVVVASSILFF
jgi:hypothetical protein